MPRREGGFLISKIKQLSDRIFDKKLKSYNILDLNSAQGRIIFTLWQKDNIAIKSLAKETALGKTTLSSMLNRLEQSNHIERNISKKDKRKTIISLTDKSKSLKGDFENVSHEMTELFYEGLTHSQITDFEVTLKHILSNLSNYEKERN